MYARVFPDVAKMLNLELTGHPTNSNPYSSNIRATDFEEDRKEYFCLGNQGNSRKQFRTNIGDQGSLFRAFLLPCRPGQPSLMTVSLVHVVNELNFGTKHDEGHEKSLGQWWTEFWQQQQLPIRRRLFCFFRPGAGVWRLRKISQEQFFIWSGQYLSSRATH